MTQISKKRPKAATSTCCPDLAGLFEPRFFKALCEPNRIALLARLAQCCKPCSVTEMNECCPINISVVSRHLALLRDAGIIEAQKRGKEVYYSVRYSALSKTLRRLADAIDDCCGQNQTQTRETAS